MRAPPQDNLASSAWCGSSWYSPADSRSSALSRLGRLDLDQEPDVAVVHPEDGHRALRHEPHRAEHGAVAAEGHDQVDAVGEVVVVDHVDPAADALGVRAAGEQLALAGRVPALQGRHGLLHVLGRVDDEADDGLLHDRIVPSGPPMRAGRPQRHEIF